LIEARDNNSLSNQPDAANSFENWRFVMKIAIIGAGALGSVYGSYLDAFGNDVVILTRRQEHAETINKQGILIRYKDSERKYNPRASNNPSVLTDRDLIIVLVKAYDLRQVAEILLKYSQNGSMLLSLVSGLGNIDILTATCGIERVIAGVSYLGSRKVGDTIFELGNNLRTVIGEPSGLISNRISQIESVFRDSGFEISVSEDINSLIWEKMIVIASQNALGAITGLTFGQMLESQYCRNIVVQLLDELTKIAVETNVNLPQNLLEYVLNNWRSLPNHRVSMWQDLQAGKRTEIDAINGALVKLGQKYSIPTPYNEVLTNLIHMMEKKDNN
jgi:2-dehydropantoate 2-reductase